MSERRKLVIGVVGSGKPASKAEKHARELGALIAENGWVLLTGGRAAGVMDAVNQGAEEKDASSVRIGILPNAGAKISDHVAVAIITDLNNARNNIIGLSSDMLVACGVDGAGTASEIALALKNEKDVILLAPSDLAREFFQALGGQKVFVASTPGEAVEQIQEICRRAAGNA